MNDISNDRCRACGGACNDAGLRNGMECAECGMIMVRQVPSPEDLSAYYATFNDRYTGGGSTGGKNQLRYARKYIAMLRQCVTSGTVIDIGCANNPFPNLASQCGYEVTAMDYTRPEKLADSVRFVVGTLESPATEIADQEFDAITCWAVIEHVSNPDVVFSNLRKLLAPCGTILLTTPEQGSWLTKNAAGKTRWFYPPEHLHLFSPAAIERIARKNNLDLCRWGRFEISAMRWLARYGIGYIEALVGLCLASVDKRVWVDVKARRFSRHTGIAYYVLRRGRD